MSTGVSICSIITALIFMTALWFLVVDQRSLVADSMREACARGPLYRRFILV